MSILTKAVKDLIDKSPKRSTNVFEKLYSNVGQQQKNFHELNDYESVNQVLHSPFLVDFKRVSWYYKTLVKYPDIPDDKNQILFDIEVFHKPEKWELYIDDILIETEKDVKFIKKRKNVYRVSNFISSKPLNLSSLQNLKRLRIVCDVEVYFHIAKVSDDCIDAMVEQENIWLIEKEFEVISLSEVKYPIKSISFASDKEITSLKIGNSLIVDIPRKLFIDENDDIQTWDTTVNNNQEDAYLPPSNELHLQPNPDYISVKCVRYLIIKNGKVEFI